MTSPSEELHWDPETVRKNAYKAVDWVVDYLSGVESRRVYSDAEPGSIFDSLPAAPPEEGEDFDSILKDMDELVMPGLTHWQHPSWFAFFNANTSGPSLAADILSSGLAVQGMLWQTSPACTEVETRMMDWLLDLLGLPQEFHSSGAGGGVIQDTASSATLCALIAAREKVSGFAVDQDGVTEKMTVYASGQTHSSIEKAVRIAGLGSRQFRQVATDADLRLDPADLDRQITEDRAQGQIPTMVVATVGTTATTAVDSVSEIAEVCRRHDVWLHVDSAHAGTAAIVPEMRWIHDGVEDADSFTFNPHKWMFVGFDCNAFWVKDRQVLVQALSVLPEYLRNEATESGKVIDYRDWHIPLGRRFRALKLWFVMRSYGTEGLRQLIDEHLQWARWFEGRVSEDPQWEVTHRRTMNLVCIAHKDGCDRTEAIAKALNSEGQISVTPTTVEGRRVIRFCFGGTQTRMEHVEGAWEALLRAAR